MAQIVRHVLQSGRAHINGTAAEQAIQHTEHLLEIATEHNYNMLDGILNNQAPPPEQEKPLKRMRSGEPTPELPASYLLNRPDSEIVYCTDVISLE